MGGESCVEVREEGIYRQKKGESMKKLMGETIIELEQEIRTLEGNLKTALEYNESYKNGDAMKKLYHQINLLTSFANNCIQWGAEPCRCQHHAEDALNDASEYNTQKEEL